MVAQVAAFRSGETRRLSRQLGFEVAVVAAVEDPSAHALWLSRMRHGALRTCEDWSLPWATCAAPSAVTFEVVEMDARWMGGAPLPPGLSLSGGTLQVTLAGGARLRDFAVAFAAAMQDITFEHVARRPGQVARRHRSGRQLDVGARYTFDSSSTRVPAVVDDLYAFRPRTMRALVGRAHQAATLVAVRSALRLASTVGIARDA